MIGNESSISPFLYLVHEIPYDFPSMAVSYERGLTSHFTSAMTLYKIRAHEGKSFPFGMNPR